MVPTDGCDPHIGHFQQLGCLYADVFADAEALALARKRDGSVVIASLSKCLREEGPFCVDKTALEVVVEVRQVLLTGYTWFVAELTALVSHVCAVEEMVAFYEMDQQEFAAIVRCSLVNSFSSSLRSVWKQCLNSLKEKRQPNKYR